MFQMASKGSKGDIYCKPCTNATQIHRGERIRRDTGGHRGTQGDMCPNRCWYLRGHAGTCGDMCPSTGGHEGTPRDTGGHGGTQGDTGGHSGTQGNMKHRLRPKENITYTVYTYI